MVQVLLALILGYLLGSIPSGALVARVYGKVDLTQVGSRRTGATNVLRTLGPGAAAIVFLGDLLKGAAAVLIARALWPDDTWAIAVAGTAAVLGHAYSPFIGFKGGRGVTTGLGAMLAIAPVAALVAAVVGIVTIATTRYVSLGSILGTLVASVAVIVLTVVYRSPVAYAAFAAVVGAFIVIAHHDNIDRLRHGTERRLGERVQETG
jgi:glycerol-3-phosphate acyltransferase PlsY